MSELDQLRREFATWKIAQHPELPAWVAETRPTERSVHVLVAHSLAQLRIKLTANAEHRAR
jgi:hypothetical protein